MNGFVRCATVNANKFSLGDIEKNKNYIIECIKEANRNNVDLLVFPELCLTGYSCQDLFYNSGFYRMVEDAIYDILEDSLSGTIYAIGAPLMLDGVRYNVAYICQNGKILGIVPKTFLPNYGEFYERRWFSPMPRENKYIELPFYDKKVPFGKIIFNAKTCGFDFKFGIEICEDLWSPIPPSSELALNGAQIILNLSASNELVGKDSYRKQLIENQSGRLICGYVYSSAGNSESSSDIVFGGTSYIAQNGSMQKMFKKGNLNISDVDVELLNNRRSQNMTFAASHQIYENKDILKISTNYTFSHKGTENAENIFACINLHPFIPNNPSELETIFNIQVDGLARRINQLNCKAIIGISGGLDSTLALLVTHKAFEKLGKDTKDIIGITMPGFGTTQMTHQNSLKLGELLGITMREIDIKKACLQHFEDIGHEPDNFDVTYENVQARERTQILMDVANKEGRIVIGTGDMSELALGWCTYNGDHMSMYGVNASIPKTLVKSLIKWIITNATCNKEHKLEKLLNSILDTPISPELLPSNGKEIVQKTESVLGSYELHDFFLFHYQRNGFGKDKILELANIAFNKVYSENEIKKCFETFIKRYYQNQFKRNCLPDGPQVGSVSMSPRGSLRLPSDLDYKSFINM